MRVTVVTPNYNGAPTLERTIWSVLNQEHTDLEHIVVDDGSTDASREILSRYSGKLRVIEKAKGGQPTAVNAGLRAATGELVCWLNSDDLLLRGAVGRAAEAFESDPRASMVYGDYVVIDESDAVTAVRRQPSYHFNTSLYGYLTVSNACVFFRRSAVERAGFADESLPRACDMDLFLRVATLGRVIHIPQFMGAYRNRMNSIHVSQAAALEDEAWAIRSRHSPHLTRRQLHLLHGFHKFAAASRMLLEGAAWCRMWPFGAFYLAGCQQLVNSALQHGDARA